MHPKMFLPHLVFCVSEDQASDENPDSRKRIRHRHCTMVVRGREWGVSITGIATGDRMEIVFIATPTGSIPEALGVISDFAYAQRFQVQRPPCEN